jgi:hypothetical protein
MKLLLTAALLGLLPSLKPIAPQPQPTATIHVSSAPAADSTTVRLLCGSTNAEFTELMGRVLHVEKQRVVLHDHRLAGRRLHLTLQEYQRGVPGPEKEFTSNASITRLDSAGRFEFAVYARQVSKTIVENNFILPHGGVIKSFTAAPTQVGDYSLRFDIHPQRRSPDQTGGTADNPVKEFRLPIGPAVVLAVYTLPYESDGLFLYCGLAQSRVPVADWYTKFKVPHYVVYRVRVE